MDPFTAWLAKRGLNWWLAHRPFSKEKRAARKERRKVKRENRRRKKDGLPPLEVPKMESKQVLQGGMTHSGLGLTAVAFVLNQLQLVPDGYDAVTVAGVVVGLVVAAYGRIRREWRA